MKQRDEIELLIEEYFGLNPTCDSNQKIDVTYSDLVDLGHFIKYKTDISDMAFVAGRSKQSWESFKDEVSK